MAPRRTPPHPRPPRGRGAARDALVAYRTRYDRGGLGPATRLLFETDGVLLRELEPQGRLRRTILHPGHICGRGWPPLNPSGHFNPFPMGLEPMTSRQPLPSQHPLIRSSRPNVARMVFDALRRGEPVAVPNLGMESVHHVHAGAPSSQIQ